MPSSTSLPLVCGSVYVCGRSLTINGEVGSLSLDLDLDLSLSFVGWLSESCSKLLSVTLAATVSVQLAKI